MVHLSRFDHTEIIYLMFFKNKLFTKKKTVFPIMDGYGDALEGLRLMCQVTKP
jgi:hypothetical protein